MKIIVITRNWHKFREIKWCLKDIKSIDLLSLNAYGNYAPLKTEGLPADLKAKAESIGRHASQATGQWVLAETSALIIPSIGKHLPLACCVESEQTTDDVQNCKELLRQMKQMSDLQRAAHYECAITLASPDGYIKSVSAYVEGSIAETERGNRGFGYDALFLKHDYDKTFGEMDEEVKNRVSHRAKALQKVSVILEALSRKNV